MQDHDTSGSGRPVSTPTSAASKRTAGRRMPMAALASALLAGATLAMNAQAGTPIGNGAKISLLGHHGKWVVAENGGKPPTPLKADRHIPTWWETFTMTQAPGSDGRQLLQTAAGSYVSQSVGQLKTATYINSTTGLLFAKQRVVDLNGGRLEEGDTVALQSASGHYWTAEPNGTLTTRVNQIKQWQRFQIFLADGPAVASVRAGQGLPKPKVVGPGARLAFKTRSGKWVAAENGGRKGSPLATRPARKTWETFLYRRMPGSARTALMTDAGTHVAMNSHYGMAVGFTDLPVGAIQFHTTMDAQLVDLDGGQLLDGDRVRVRSSKHTVWAESNTGQITMAYGNSGPHTEFTVHVVGHAEAFAPVLYFDRGADGYGYPMDAQAFFNECVRRGNGVWAPMAAGQPCNARVVQNRNFADMQRARPPIYYQIEGDISGQLRIIYWFFYGYQDYCVGSDAVNAVKDTGRHQGDWERIMVTTTQDRTRIASVTYYQHGGYYTRVAAAGSAACNLDPAGGTDRCGGSSGFQVEGRTHPRVYVGKKAHGSYHNRHTDTFLGADCTYYGDFRNPDGRKRLETRHKLINLDTSNQPWVIADRQAHKTPFEWGYDGVGTRPTQPEKRVHFGLKACTGRPTRVDGSGDNGCHMSECVAGDSALPGQCLKQCKPGYTTNGIICTLVKTGSSKPWEKDFYTGTKVDVYDRETYGLGYLIPGIDAGLARNRQGESEWRNIP